MLLILLYVTGWVLALRGAMVLGHHLTVRSWQRPRPETERRFNWLRNEYRKVQGTR